MPAPYRTTIAAVPLEQGLREDEGWVDMQVQFLVDERTAGSSVWSSGARCSRRERATSDTGTRTATSSWS